MDMVMAGDSSPVFTLEAVNALLPRVRALMEVQMGRRTDIEENLEKLAKVNDALSRIERAFLLPGGLPGRPWFAHAIYAPGLTTGYASWPLPGLRQALEDKDAPLFAAAADALTARIAAATAALADATGAAR